MFGDWMSLYDDLKKENSRSLSVEAQNKPPQNSGKYPIKFDGKRNKTLDEFFRKYRLRLGIRI